MNLVRGDLLPPNWFKVAQKPHRLTGASQDLITGGQLEANVKIRINGFDYNTDQPVELDMPIQCFHVKIKHDMIISYNWLVENQV